MTPTSLALSFLVCFIAWILRNLVQRLFSRSKLPGPPNPSFVFGHAFVLAQSPIGRCYNVWERQYGPTYMLRGPFGGEQLIVGDPKGSQYILNGKSFERNAGDRAALELFFGRGLFCAEGEEHRKMRKSVSGPFTNSSILEIAHVFVELAERLISDWEQRIVVRGSKDTFDVTQDVHRLTLDAISMTMFSHDLSATNGDVPNLLKKITHSPPAGRTHILLGAIADNFPLILRLPSAMKAWCDNLRGSLGVVAAEVWSGHEGAGMHAKLINALAESKVEPSEAVAQIIGIIFAGSETTANVITECFYEMARNPDVQDKLREELANHELKTGRQPTPSEIANASVFPYLDAVTRETMRTKAVLTSISRVAVRDDIIPLQIPLGCNAGGADQYSLPVKAGTLIDVPIRDGINVSEKVWGNDAASFDPGRWLDPGRLPNTVEWVHAPGHVLTFGDGPKMCLGRSFALMEFKIIVAKVLQRFVFKEAGGTQLDFYHVGGNTIKPMIRGREIEGTQMPLEVYLNTK